MKTKIKKSFIVSRSSFFVCLLLVTCLLSLVTIIGCGGGGTKNNAPVISSIDVSPSTTVNTGASITLTCNATDADGDTLSYSWTASGGTISGSGSSVTWTAPNTAGTYTITVKVSDGKGGEATASKTITVSASGTKTAQKVAAGGGHTCAVMKDGTIKCWGANSNGQLGNGTNTDSNTPVSVSSSLYTFRRLLHKNHFAYRYFKYQIL